MDLASFVAKQVACCAPRRPISLGIRSVQPMEQSMVDCLVNSRLFPGGDFNLWIFPGRKLLQIRLSGRPIPFRPIANFSVRGESPKAGRLSQLQDVRLHSRWILAARLRAETLSTEKEEQR